MAAVVATPVTAVASIAFSHRGSLRLQQDQYDQERLQRLEELQVGLLR